MFLLGASRLGSLTSLYLRFTFLFHLTSSVTGSAALKHGFLSYRLLRMNVQGCHNILAICPHIEFETMTASGPVHHPLKTYIFLSHYYSKLIIVSRPRGVTTFGSVWGYPPPPHLAKKNSPPYTQFRQVVSKIFSGTSSQNRYLIWEWRKVCFCSSCLGGCERFVNHKAERSV